MLGVKASRLLRARGRVNAICLPAVPCERDAEWLFTSSRE